MLAAEPFAGIEPVPAARAGPPARALVSARRRSRRRTREVDVPPNAQRQMPSMDAVMVMVRAPVALAYTTVLTVV